MTRAPLYPGCGAGVLGYWLVGADGEVSGFGEASPSGSSSRHGTANVVVGIAAMAGGAGYWLVTADGDVSGFGQVPHHGSLPDSGIVARIVGMAAIADGAGYWLVGADGGVFAFGEAPFHGSVPEHGITAQVVGMAAMADGAGYWLVGADGGVFAFGGAPFHGSVPDNGGTTQIAGMAAIADGSGYLLAGTDGDVHPFGVAAFHGSASSVRGRSPIVGLALLGAPEALLGERASELLGAIGGRLDEAARGMPADSAAGALLLMSGLAFPAVDAPRVSIVIPVYGQAELTARCLRAVAAAGGAVPYEVIVVDDASPDDMAMLFEGVDHLTVVRNETNLGYTRASNAGIAVASGEYVVLLNNDTEVHRGWLEALTATADRDPSVGVVGARLVYADGSLQEAGGIIWSDGTGANYGRGGDAGGPEYGYVREVDYCSGACLLVRQELFRQLGGGLDERYAPAYYEDADLAFAARSLGYKVLYQPKAIVVHHEGGSHGTDLSTGVKRFQDVNHAVFSAKWKDALAAQRPPGSSVILARDARTGPRAIVVDHMVPLYDQDAGSVRMLALITILVELGFVVTFVPNNWLDLQPYTDRLQQMGVEVLYGPVPFGAHLAAMGKELVLCILSRPNVACQFIGTVRVHAPQAIVIYDTVDLHFLRERRCAELEGNKGVLKSSVATKEIELAMVRAADVTLTVSAVEQQVLLDEVPDAVVRIVPTIHQQHPASSDVRQRRDLLFVGSFLHEPNRDAALHLVADIMPLVRRALPDVRLRIVGSNPTPDVLALAGDGVEVLGWVPNLEPLYEDSRVFVAPLRYGAGMKGKIGESLSHGLPAVTSSIGAEGIGLTSDRNILLADTPASFAAQVIRLYTDTELWTDVAAGGRAFIEARYSPATVRDEVAKLLADIGVLPTLARQGVPS